MSAKPNGIVLYRGPSLLDGAPIVVILTGLQSASANRKTGDMLQTWILSDVESPIKAVQSGGDRAICGDCPQRGIDGKARGCYVTVAQGPNSVWRAYQRGNYPRATMEHYQAINGRPVRFGTYGDPAAVPFDTWSNLLRFTSDWTGYTHQWRTCSRAYQALCMASVETLEDMHDARRLGWRTFRVRSGESALFDEVMCPASAEMGHRTTCADCQLCKGSSVQAKHIAIIAHGTGKRFALTLTR